MLFESLPELKEKYAEDSNEGIIDDTLENTRRIIYLSLLQMVMKYFQ